MPEDKPSLHIDTDWKKQAQEEKRKLVEETEKKKQSEKLSTEAASPSGATGQQARGAGKRQLPPASFASIVQSMMTQALFYLGDIATANGEGGINLDMAKHHIDSLSVLEEKTRGNLSAEEQKFLDAALYETRMRFVGIAGQIINP